MYPDDPIMTDVLTTIALQRTEECPVPDQEMRRCGEKVGDRDGDDRIGLWG